ncbi:hypothetical protein 9L [Ranavirus ambystoma1]|uniref:Uncharacterized protein n=1 Tax=Ranavirus ambystoma1 TaxID=265294 RepID=A0A0U2QJH4_9VIRU|nr:hypothetical protein 9L [Ambystoma tigrinum virus]ALN37010.1 hypothetical protein 9L [Ambystoma tigrinum virus]ALN37310.1 hypothetical protein 9L [Ambystoma tigrinum virus]ALN37511.1 hypothetical protein 9L [Ambystoma tigrinum virus]ALN37710.1 hypothetical protein 9L [Ambystoma tigrinum virus]
MCVSVCRLADGNSVCVFLGSRIFVTSETIPSLSAKRDGIHYARS